jgi:hypothetical protein
VGLDDRIRRLEDGRVFPRVLDPDEMHERMGWHASDQLDSVLAALQVHRWGGSKQQATDRELTCLQALVDEGVVSPDAWDYFERIPPDEQPAREAWLYANRERSAKSSKATLAWADWVMEHGSLGGMPEHIKEMYEQAEGVRIRGR